MCTRSQHGRKRPKHASQIVKAMSRVVVGLSKAELSSVQAIRWDVKCILFIKEIFKRDFSLFIFAEKISFEFFIYEFTFAIGREKATGVHYRQ